MRLTQCHSYARIFEQLKPQWSEARLRLATFILALLACAKRPLRLHEIQGALSVDIVEGSVDFDGRKLRMDIRALCGAFVNSRPDDTIELVHPTAKQ
jgi:hypothetical protein